MLIKELYTTSRGRLYARLYWQGGGLRITGQHAVAILENCNVHSNIAQNVCSSPSKPLQYDIYTYDLNTNILLAPRAGIERL